MSYVKKVEVTRTVILEFTLPGVSASWSSGSGGSHEKQFDHRYAELWCLRVNQENALATADIFAGVAKSIRESFEKDGKP